MPFANSNQQPPAVGPSRRRTGRLIGAWLRKIRQAAGLTQAQLAQATGLAQPTISKLERGAGEGGPELSTLERYVAGCGMVLALEAKSAVPPDGPADLGASMCVRLQSLRG